MLHITNGDSVQLRETGIGGETLVWADVLHDGPVPASLELEELSAVRARFLAECGWAEQDAFAQRDRRLQAFRSHEEVVLWFEHDLFDQLLVLQLLDWFGAQDRRGTRLTLIGAGDYLGPMPPAALAALFPSRHEVTAAEFALASAAWNAFRSADPGSLERLAAGDTSALPHLRPALLRHLEQFPSARSGLSRTERQILEAAQSGIDDRVQLYLANQKREERIFMGDSTFFRYIDNLQSARHPLLDANLRLTAEGAAVLAGKQDAIALNGIDRWLGGVHLEGMEARWRWEEGGRRLVTELPR